MGRYKVPSDRSKKRAKGSPTFVCTIPLRVTPRKLTTAQTRFEVSRLHYNACLSECLHRVEKIRSDPRYEMAKTMPKKVNGHPNPKRSALYTTLREDYCFEKFDINSYGSFLRKDFIRDHVGAQVAQVIAGRAYDAANSWFTKLRGRPRFKASGHGLHSLVVNDSCGDMRITKDGDGIIWAGLILPFALDPSDPVYLWAAIHVAAGKLLRVGITKTMIKGRPTYRALLVFDGVPLQRYEVGEEKITLDPGLGYANIVTDTGVYREELAGPNGTDPGISFDQKRIRRLSREFDRQHRAKSPNCFDESGRHVQGRCFWEERSKESLRTQARLSETHRKMAGHRSTLHGNLQNRILGLGVNGQVEKNSYKSFQRNFGRSVRDRAPGGFISGLLRKAESAGGTIREGDPRLAAPSQRCVCTNRKKKPLSLRIHQCDKCGIGPIQRDVFSAFLWRHIGVDATLDAPKARKELSRRQDIAVHAAAGDFKQQVRKARKCLGHVDVRSASELFAADPQNPIPRSREPEMGLAPPRAVVYVLATAAV